MAPNEFLEIAAYSNAVEAEHVRNVLESHGMSAFIDGAAAGTALSYIGTAVGGVRVLVRAEEARQARLIVENVRAESDMSSEPWFCGTCGETIDGTFEVCWSCGETREHVERPFPVPPESESEKLPEGFALDKTANLPTSDTDGERAANPYSPPSVRENIATSNDQHAEYNDEAEAIVLRAWRASIIGFLLLPGVLHVYSMYLLVRAAMIKTTFSPDGQKRFYRALGLNVVGGCVWGLAIKYFFQFG